MADQIPTQPVPFNINLTTVHGPLGTLIRIQTDDPTGTKVLFMPLDLARQVASKLSELAGGIVLPTLVGSTAA